MTLTLYQNPTPIDGLESATHTGLLNISLLACAAMPPFIFGAFERRADTPSTLNRSANVAVCVSEIAWGSGTSMADGGAIDMVPKGIGRRERCCCY